MRLLANSAVLAGAVAGVLACSKPQPPTVNPERVTVTGADAQSVQLDVTLTATNPNSVDLTVQDVTAHVVLGGKVDLGATTVAKEYTLPAGKPTTIDALVSVPWGDVSAIAQLASSAPTVPFTVDGTVELGGSLLHVTVPYHLTGSIAQKQLVAASLKALVPGLALPR
jgi:LEA14-like dessication related protein